MSTTLRVGILGAPNNVQPTFLPTLTSLPTYKLTAIYDQNDSTAKTTAKKFNIQTITNSAHDLISHNEVDLVLNLLSFEYHEQFTIAALEAGKHVMVEVPLSLSIHGLRRIRAATQNGANNTSTGTPPKVFVGCARRYAPCFTDLFKKELASMGRIYYARCRNIAGPLHIPAMDMKMSGNGISNSNGNRTNTRLQAEAQANGITSLPSQSQKQFQALLSDIFGSTDDLTPDRIAFCRFLGNLGCHDLSLMRESLGFPDAVANIAITDPFYSAIFHYTSSKAATSSSASASVSGNSNSEPDPDGHPFTVLYETGVDSVPRCDAHLTVYGAQKTISVEYDFPCLAMSEEDGVTGSVKVVVEELESKVDIDHGGRPRVKRTEVVSSAAEAYEREFLAMHSYFVGDDSGVGVNGCAVEAKTTANDALMDLRLLHMIFEHYDRQCGTIRTPLG
ncbi:Oxidoreductase N-terminal [Penicillium angulare]|uniref:Oxidoreductase N-terminal n=1 Tax=Penicillium angulare TaxID=116970 RepID=UPI0025400862|nr:Oxidoreductase N-terminal [Penicillium angulare]KAJ5272709.1 Oxidoreductase N-terminal [Penicillium angulare]